MALPALPALLLLLLLLSPPGLGRVPVQGRGGQPRRAKARTALGQARGGLGGEGRRRSRRARGCRDGGVSGSSLGPRCASAFSSRITQSPAPPSLGGGGVKGKKKRDRDGCRRGAASEDLQRERDGPACTARRTAGRKAARRALSRAQPLYSALTIESGAAGVRAGLRTVVAA